MPLCFLCFLCLNALTLFIKLQEDCGRSLDPVSFGTQRASPCLQRSATGLCSVRILKFPRGDLNGLSPLVRDC